MGNNPVGSNSSSGSRDNELMERRSREILDRFERKVEEIEKGRDKLNKQLDKIKRDVRLEVKGGDFDKVKKILKKQYWIEKTIDECEDKLDSMREIKKNYDEISSGLHGYERYDSLVGLLEEPEISSIIDGVEGRVTSTIVEGSLDFATSSILSNEGMNEWVEEQIKKVLSQGVY